MVRGASVGDGMLESSSMEFEEKREPKTVALSVGETAIVSSEWKSRGKVERQKLLKILLRTSKIYLWKKMRSHFF